MILTLSAKSELGFGTGDIPKPDPTSSNLKGQERCNDSVCSWLIFNLKKTIAKIALFLVNASDIWKELEEDLERVPE